MNEQIQQQLVGGIIGPPPPPISDRIVSSFTDFRSSLIDLRPSRSIHVTNVCRQNGSTTNGDRCRATHFGLSDLLQEEELLLFGNNKTIPAEAAMANNNNSSNNNVSSSSQSSSATSSWKASFMSTRERFSTPHKNHPIQLKLGGSTTQTGGTPSSATSSGMSSPQVMTTSGDEWSFEKLFGVGGGGGGAEFHHHHRRSAATPSPTPINKSNSTTTTFMPPTNNVDGATAKEIETRFVALNDLIRGITFLGTTNGVSSQQHQQQSSSVLQQSNKPSTNHHHQQLGFMATDQQKQNPNQNDWRSPQQQQYWATQNGGGTLQQQQQNGPKLLDKQSPRRVPHNSLSMSSAALFVEPAANAVASQHPWRSPPGGAAGPRYHQTLNGGGIARLEPANAQYRHHHPQQYHHQNQNQSQNQTPTNGGVGVGSGGIWRENGSTNKFMDRHQQSIPVTTKKLHRGVPPPNLVLSTNAADFVINHNNADPANSSSSLDNDGMALKIIDEVQQFLQTNTETLKKCGRFPVPASLVVPTATSSPTPTSPTSTSSNNLSTNHLLTRQVVDDRYPSSSLAPLSPSATSSAVRRAMLDYHHHQRTSSSNASLSSNSNSMMRQQPRQLHHHHQMVSTGSVAERVNQFEPTNATIISRQQQQQGNRVVATAHQPKMVAEETTRPSSSFFHFQLPNSIAGVSASIIHQPSVVTTAASSSAKLQQQQQQQIDCRSPPPDRSIKNREKLLEKGETTVAAAPSAAVKLNEDQEEAAEQQENKADEDEEKQRYRRVAVLDEIEKALQGLPAGVASESSPTTAVHQPSATNLQRSPRIKNNGSIDNVTDADDGATAILGVENFQKSQQDRTTTNGAGGLLSLRALLNRQQQEQKSKHHHHDHQSTTTSSSRSAESIIAKTADVFRTLALSGKAELGDFGRICAACDLPTCLKKALFDKCCGQKKKTFVVQYDLTHFWTGLGEDAADKAVVLVRLLSNSSNGNANGNGNGLSEEEESKTNHRRYLLPEDFVELVQTVVDDHPGLSFLREAPEFHSRYVQTVIARIFFSVNRSWSGRLTAAEIRRSNLLDVLHRLDEEEDINRITDFFSYEHFYVIYCKFWELDRDHDLLIDKEDLSRFDDYALSRRAVERIFSPALNNDRKSLDEGKMTYPQFVKFILAEKDKRHPTSVEYWFRCMDLDGDGVISIYELQRFYDEQAEKMILCGIEPMPFDDILCQVLDMIRPRTPLKITLADLKQCQMATVFFDTFLNLHRYLEHEQMESGGGGMNAAMRNGTECNDNRLNDWNLYAAEEYEALVAEEADLGMEIKCDSDDDER